MTEQLPLLLAGAITGPTFDLLAPQNGVVDEKTGQGMIFEAYYAGLEGDINLIWKMTVVRAEPGPLGVADVVVVGPEGNRCLVRIPCEAGQYERVASFHAKRGELIAIRLYQHVRGVFTIEAAELHRAPKT